MHTIALLLFSVCFSRTVLSASAERATYIAGVVEYHQPHVPIYDAIDMALEAYEHYMEEARLKSVDILVFPEATVNYFPTAAIKIPTAEDNENPCDNPKSFSKILKRLSCAAKKNSLYVVVNLAERTHFCDEVASDNCTNTAENDILYNTNIILDRQGTIISKYRKINLYIEPGFTPSPTKDLGVFDTDFGVTFGHFVCFDIIFQQPAVEVVERKKVRNVVYPTMWFSILPFYAATAMQESWASIHNVNLLAAGANNVKKGNTGTGIYAGKKGMQVGSIYGEERSRMFVLELSKDPDAPEALRTNSNTAQEVIRPNPEIMDSLHMYQDDLTLYSSKELQITESQNITLQYNDVKCDFFIKIKQLSQTKEDSYAYTYKAVVFEGVKRITETTTAGSVNCGIVACLNSSLESCGLRFPKYSMLDPSIEITDIKITATVTKPVLNKNVGAMDRAYGPITLDTSIMTIGIDNYVYSVSNHLTDSTKQILTMTLKKPQTELLTFAIMGRIFKNDGLPVSTAVQVTGYPLTVAAAYLLQTTMF